MIFGSDNMVGASPRVLAAIQAANEGTAPSYGADPWCAAALAALGEVFERPVQAYFVSTGTVANSLALAALVPPWGAVLCQRDGHVLADESSAPEFFTGGARLVPLAPVAGKLTPEVVAARLANTGHPPHHAVPRALSITQANERGLVYTPDEVAALARCGRGHGLRMHMDGARFANAVASLGCSPAELTWKAGVDVLCLGASKNGALMAEAVVFFDAALARDFEFRVKRAGQMAAKARFFGAQFGAWLADGHWLALAHGANAVAARLAAGLDGVPGVRRVWPVQANEVFVVLPRALGERLRAQGAVFYDWPEDTLPEGQALGAHEMLVRFVASFASRPEDADALIAAAAAAGA
ncbi:low specificity L-threonine aldolase [Verticiella sediminum]|uniref:L-threonine aldolase n=1 Tax=Verticiella sediminum TaxID=1247510 RepID=A0A556AZM7_9BURK|nr:beta-eliminating lyase-related protein [Verticiella sediminum]TSH98374.1 low specificity L-threonine aldolase [Verticiella sediminum]